MIHTCSPIDARVVCVGTESVTTVYGLFCEMFEVFRKQCNEAIRNEGISETYGVVQVLALPATRNWSRYRRVTTAPWQRALRFVTTLVACASRYGTVARLFCQDDDVTFHAQRFKYLCQPSHNTPRSTQVLYPVPILEYFNFSL